MSGEDQLRQWLEARGLAACAQALIDNAVDLEILPDLSDQDLASIGLLLGLRRKLLKAAAELRATTDAPAPQAAASSPAREATRDRGERRYITVMFCDLVGSTRIAAALDAEEWRDLVAAYHAVVAAAVEPLGGNVAQKLGDGAMVYFGYPRAEENDAERAVRGALAIFAGLAGLNRALVAQGKQALEARIGLHSGPVVVDGGEFAFGEVPNVAARVQTAAEPGQILISEAVHRQVAGLFVVEDRGAHALKGVPEPVRLLRVARASGASRRAAREHSGTPFVGREDELRLLRNRWERARSGEPRLVELMGEAGLGKSRLLNEFRLSLAGEPHTWAEWPCAQLLQSTSFHPVAEWGRRRFGAGDDGRTDGRLADVKATLAALGLDIGEALPLLAPLFDLPVAEGAAVAAASPEDRRRRQLAMMASWVVAGARAQPLVLVLEDAQWADPSTLEVIGSVVEQTAEMSLLVVVAARPEFRAPWAWRGHHERFALAPLGKDDSGRVVREVLKGRPLSDDTIAAVVARSGGIPLFLEEVARLLLEGGGEAGAHQIPPTLHASLLARLDRLGEAKEVAQIGAVLGREFGWSLIRQVAGIGDDALAAALDRLAAAEIVHAEGRPPDAAYRFDHALFQDAAYDSLLKSRRRDLHGGVARALSASFPENVRQRPELLAHHLTEAGDVEPAIRAWQRAGELAATRAAFVEASSHYERGIVLLATLPEAARRSLDEFKMRSALAQCYWACKGFGAAETRAAFETALAIGESLGETRTLATVLSGLVAALTQQAEYNEAQGYADRLSALAGRPDCGPFERGWAALRQGTIRFYRGDLVLARDLFREVRTLGAQGADTAIGGVSLNGMASIYLPWLASLTDDWELALSYADELLRSAKEAGSPHDRAFALTGAVIAGLQLGDVAGVDEWLRTLLALTDEYRLRVLRSSAVLFQAWATRQRGDPEQAARQFADGLRDYVAIGQRVLLNWFKALHADAVAATGDIDGALAIAEEAVASAACSPLYAPEALRIQASIQYAKVQTLAGTLAQDLARTAERNLQQAGAEARRLGVRLFRPTVTISEANAGI